MTRIPAARTAEPKAANQDEAPATPVLKPIPVAAAATVGPRTLAIDIGGSRLKAGVLDAAGRFVAGPGRNDTPYPATPAAVLTVLEGIVGALGAFDRISVGFPGVVRHGRVFTAPNLGTEAWARFPLGPELASRFGKPARVLNDASVQGLGVIAGVGLECVITLGTGMGFALFQDGLLAPHLEMGQHIARKKLTYDHYIGNAALAEIGLRKWNRRMVKAIAALDVLVTYDTLLIGGGNAKHIDFALPPRAQLVPNQAGITGGVRLWDTRMDASPEFAVTG